MDNLSIALQQLIELRPYVSPTMVDHLKRPKNITLDSLTEKEQVVLSVIGDGSDDLQAAQKLGISSHTVNTHRKSIMARLRLHHKGVIILHAVQEGYVWVTRREVFYPGFQRQLQSLSVEEKDGDAAG